MPVSPCCWTIWASTHHEFFAKNCGFFSFFFSFCFFFQPIFPPVDSYGKLVFNRRIQRMGAPRIRGKGALLNTAFSLPGRPHLHRDRGWPHRSSDDPARLVAEDEARGFRHRPRLRLLRHSRQDHVLDVHPVLKPACVAMNLCSSVCVLILYYFDLHPSPGRTMAELQSSVFFANKFFATFLSSCSLMLGRNISSYSCILIKWGCVQSINRSIRSSVRKNHFINQSINQSIQDCHFKSINQSNDRSVVRYGKITSSIN